MESQALGYQDHWGFPGGSAGKESACNTGDPDLIPELGRSPGPGHDNPLQCSCLENPPGQRSLVGYSPWDHKESDMTEQLSEHKQELVERENINFTVGKLAT